MSPSSPLSLSHPSSFAPTGHPSNVPSLGPSTAHFRLHNGLATLPSRPSRVSQKFVHRTKRARKTKCTNILALTAQPSTCITQAKLTQPSCIARLHHAHPSRHPSRLASCSPSPASLLDMSSIRTEAPRNMPKSRQVDRLFGLEHCPIFYPTVDEFKDPMRYFELISPRLRSFGIGKVVPPLGWKPPFVLDTVRFKFKTRLQRLNSMEASARANLNLLEQLYIFHKQQGNSSFVANSPKLHVPVVDYRPVDLWKLRKHVNEMGGYDNVTSQRKWSFLAKSMGYNVKGSPAISFKLKGAYMKIVAPFDNYVNRVKTLPARLGKKEDKNDLSPTASLSSLSSSIADHEEADSSHIAGKEATGSKDGSVRPTHRSSERRTSNASLGQGDPTWKTNHSWLPKNPSRLPLELPPSRSSVQLRRRPSVLSSASTSEKPQTRPHLSTTSYQVRKASSDREGDQICEICGTDEDDSNILLCDCCDKGYHLQCLTPPLEAVPDGDWYCDTCIVSTGNEFGFEEGKEHTLSSFQRRADGFKRMWIETHPAPSKKKSLADKQGSTNIESEKEDEHEPESVWSNPEFKEELALEDHIEREFWRLVESQTETVEVEYGADIHSATYGSGFPNLERHPFEPYSRDGWNLNNLPIAPGSLLRFIKSDIAGMTQPWIYVGMVFSTFAWHKEDHYTYSINYHHWGDTKTWYGVPGEDDCKLEEAMKMAAPELFEQQPDLMYQLVTLMSPGRLKRAGVRTYVCDQRPNEFVITCPRSYHSGFNHGFNLNEAVNFCLPDWLNEGKLCVKHYKALQKMPVFSHDELLVTIFHHEKKPRASRWLLPHFREMVEREIADRQTALSQIPNLSPDIKVEPGDLPEEQVQCHHCKSFVYLSQVTSLDSPTKVSCFDHSDTLGAGRKVLRFKYSDEELQAMLQRVSSRSIKAGRVVEVGSVEQRTSSRKRKPSAALLEAARAALPMAQRTKFAHIPSAANRDAQSDASAPMDNSLVSKREESFALDDDEALENESLASDWDTQPASMTRDEWHETDAHRGRSSLLMNGSRVGCLAATSLATSAPSPVPALVNRPLPTVNPQTVKLSQHAIEPVPRPTPSPRKRLDSSANPLSVPPTSVSLASPSVFGQTTSARTAQPEKKRGPGRPPKAGRRPSFPSAEARKTAPTKSHEPDKLTSRQTTPAHRFPVVAQIDVGGSASIVKLSPTAPRPVLEAPKSPSRVHQTSPEFRKWKSRAINQSCNPHPAEVLPAAPPPRPASSNELFGQSSARLNPHAAVGSQSLESHMGGKTIDHFSRSIGPRKTTCLSRSSHPAPSETFECDTVQVEPPQPRPPPVPLEIISSYTRSSTPSSLMNILNPVSADPNTSREPSTSVRSSSAHEVTVAAPPLHHNPASSGHLKNLFHMSRSSPQPQFTSEVGPLQSPARMEPDTESCHVQNLHHLHHQAALRAQEPIPHPHCPTASRTIPPFQDLVPQCPPHSSQYSPHLAPQRSQLTVSKATHTCLTSEEALEPKPDSQWLFNPEDHPQFNWPC